MRKKSKKEKCLKSVLLIALAWVVFGTMLGTAFAADAPAKKITDDLFGYWRFDEATVDSFSDASGKCPVATPDNWLKNSISMVPGKIGSALAFDGNGNKWGNTLPVSGKELSGKIQDFCMAFWIQPVAWNKDKAVDQEPGRWGKNEFIRKGHSFMVILNKDDNETAGEIQFMIYKPNWHQRSASYKLPLKQWTFVVWNFTDKKGGQLFINGKAQGELVGEADDVIPAGSDALGIGRNTANVMLDEFAVWGRTLSEAEISDLYNEGKGKAIIPAQ